MIASLSTTPLGRFDDTLLRAMTPDPFLSVWEWAERFRILPSDSARPGPKSYHLTPYLREIAEALSMHSPFERVVFRKGSQVGATDLGADWLGHTIHLAPSTVLLVWPTVEFAQRKSRELIDPLIETTPVLRGLVSPARTKDAQNTILVKRYQGGRLVMTGANSGIGLRSTAAQRIYLDELDSFAQIAGKEGDPVRLATRAARTFKGRTKVYIASTPLDEATSLTTREFLRADVARDFHLPCPFCGVFQALEWGRMRWEVRGEGEAVTVTDVHYECVGCAGHIYNHHKATMLGQGKWVDRWNNGGVFSVAFQLSALYSPVGWYAWEDAALAWVQAKGNPNEEKPFMNTVLGLPYSEPAEAPPWEALYNRREEYREGVVQPGVGFLTMAVDVQNDRLEVEVKGWGREGRAWSLLYRAIVGDPLDEPVWAELERLLKTEWPAIGNDGVLPIWCCAVDSGKFPQRVYRWVRTQQQARFANSAILVGEPRTVIAVKGRDVWSQTLLTPQKASAEEKRRGLKVVGVGVSKLKKELYQSLRQVLNEDGSEPPGYRHWPTSYDQAYFRGLTAERLLVKVVHGRPKEVWEEPSGCRNEPMDLDNYNRAAAAACGLDRMTTRDWERIEKKLPLSLLRSTVVRPSQGSDASGGSGSGELGKTPIEPVEPPEPVVARVPAVELPRIAVPTRGLAHNAKWAGRTRLGSGSMY